MLKINISKATEVTKYYLGVSLVSVSLPYLIHTSIYFWLFIYIYIYIYIYKYIYIYIYSLRKTNNYVLKSAQHKSIITLREGEDTKQLYVVLKVLCQRINNLQPGTWHWHWRYIYMLYIVYLYICIYEY